MGSAQQMYMRRVSVSCLVWVYMPASVNGSKVICCALVLQIPRRWLDAHRDVAKRLH